MKILVTGFDPFGGEQVNPAYEAVKMIPNVIAGADIIKREIPTVFGEGGDAVEKLVRELSPDIVINVGQAGGRSTMCMEKVAINLQEASIKDNGGNQPVNFPIRVDGETAYFSTLPVKAMVESMTENGIPATISYTAGTYVCNDVMYRVAYMIAKEKRSMRSGFIHVPYAPEQAIGKPAGMPSMALSMIADGIAYAIEAAVKCEADSDVIMGEIM